METAEGLNACARPRPNGNARYNASGALPAQRVRGWGEAPQVPPPGSARAIDWDCRHESCIAQRKRPQGGWRFGNTMDGCQAEYVLVPHANANLCPVPDGLTDEQVLMCPDIMSTGFAGAESGQIRIGDSQRGSVTTAS